MTEITGTSLVMLNNIKKSEEALRRYGEAAAAAERAKIVAWLRGNAMSDRWSALATAIEAGEYRNG